MAFSLEHVRETAVVKMMLRPLARAAVRGTGVLRRACSKFARPQPALDSALFRSRFGLEEGASLSSASRRPFSMISDMGSKDWRSRGDLQPAPRQLSEVVKLPLLKREDSSTVRFFFAQCVCLGQVLTFRLSGRPVLCPSRVGVSWCVCVFGRLKRSGLTIILGTKTKAQRQHRTLLSRRRWRLESTIC